MSVDRDTAVKGVESALFEAVAKLTGSYQVCLIDAGGDPAKEAECRTIRDRGLGFAKRAHAEMLDAVNQHWSQGS